MQEMESALSVAEQPAQESPATLDTNNDAVNAAEPQDEQQPAQEQLAGAEGQKAFAKRLQEREAQWKAEHEPELQSLREQLEAAIQQRDGAINRAWGDKGITSWDQYEQALKNAETQEQYGITVDDIRQLPPEVLQEHPFVREALQKAEQAEQQEAARAMDWAVKEFQEQLPELGVKTFDDLLTLPDYDQIRAMMGAKVHPVKAYRALHFDELVESRTKQAQQDQLKKINANGAASPGSLAHAPDSEPFFTEEQVRRMTAKEYLDNRDAVLKSRQKWKKG